MGERGGVRESKGERGTGEGGGGREEREAVVSFGVVVVVRDEDVMGYWLWRRV